MEPSTSSRFPGLAKPLLVNAFLAVAFLAPASGLAKTESYRFDPMHTRVLFQVSHAGFSNQPGEFSGSSGSLEFDPDNWSSTHFDVVIPVTSLQMGDAGWNGKILDRTFFDASKYPQARFVSTQVTKTGDKTAQVTGNLTLHGVTAPVTLAVTLNQLKRHPLTLRQTAGFSATGQLSRKAFGIDSWKSLVGDEVTLIIEAEAMRGQAPASATPGSADADTAPVEAGTSSDTDSKNEPAK